MLLEKKRAGKVIKCKGGRVKTILMGMTVKAI